MNRRDIFKKLFAHAANTGIKPASGGQPPAVVTPKHFTASVELCFLDTAADHAKNTHAGFRLSERSGNGESTVVLHAGMTRDGYLFIGDAFSLKPVEQNPTFSRTKVVLTMIPQSSGKQFLKLKAFDGYGNTLAVLSAEQVITDDPDAGLYTDDVTCVQFINQQFYIPNRKQ